jgi:hypothetical protein
LAHRHNHKQVFNKKFLSQILEDLKPLDQNEQHANKFINEKFSRQKLSSRSAEAPINFNLCRIKSELINLNELHPKYEHHPWEFRSYTCKL